MELEEISVHFQKSFEDGTKFPRIFSPYKNSRKDLEFLVNAVSKYRELLDSIIAKCGAIVFRGFEVHTGEDFNSVVQAFGWENYDYTKEGGTSTRTHVFGNVFTVNEDVPLEEDIGFHNECCYLPKVPTRLFFFCETAPAPGKGGSTSLVLGHTVYQKLLVENKSLVDELAEKNWIPLDKKVSPKFISFREDRAGRMVWFNHIRFGKRLQFADGTTISEEDYAKIMKVLEDEKVNVPWQKGDIVLLDNYAVLHDVPLEEDIGFHNECCYLPKVPTRLFFFCETAPAPGKGGSTSLVLGHTVYQKLLVENKSLVDELAEMNWIPLDKRVSPEFISFREDRAGRMVWFNHIRFGKRLQFADGTAISEEDYAKIMKVLEDEKVNVPWQKGDIVLLDNYAVLHGREGCRSTRRILISLTK